METKEQIYVKVRATPEEKQAFKKAAKRRGKFFADWMRDAVQCQLEADMLFFAQDVSNRKQSDPDAK